MMEALRTGDPPLGDLTFEEQNWLATAFAHINRIYERRVVGSPGKEAFCIFEAGKAYVQFLASWDAEKLLCEAVSATSVADMAAILTTESGEALRSLGFEPPEISPNYSQIIKIEGVEDLSYAARLAFRVLKQVYRVADFSLATFKEGTPPCGDISPRETTEPIASRETAREVITRLSLTNPRWREAKPSGEAFVIVGARPPRKES